MGVKRTSDETAKQLNKLEEMLAVEKQRIEDATTRYDLLFKQVWDIFDHEQGEGQPARFLCNDGHVLGRIVPRPSMSFDQPKLIKLIEQKVGGLKGKRLLGRITRYVPVVDQERVAEEVRKGNLDEKIVEKAAVLKANSPRRERRKAPAKMLQALEAGIVESPSEEPEEWEVA